MAQPAQPEPFDPTELLARVWQQNLPVFEQRISFLQTAALHAEAGALTETDRTEAFNIAHKLAGALGMFGYPRGTEIAQQLEVLLTGSQPLDPSALRRLATELKAAVPL